MGKSKKEKISKHLKSIEGLLFKMIDEGNDKPFTAFELITICIHSLIKEQHVKSKVGSA